MQIDRQSFRVIHRDRLAGTALVVGLVGLAVSGLGYINDAHHFFLAYHTAFVFWLSVALGGLFFTMLHHLTGAKWSIVIWRISEAIASALPIMAVLFIPVILGMHDIFEWSHAELVDPNSPSFDPLIAEKSPFLNTPFFLVRAAIYFGVWILLARLLLSVSVAQDSGYSPERDQRLKKISAPGMVAFAFTMTFAAFDWLMSIDPHWFSTIFGVYVFSGAFLAAMTFHILFAIYLRTGRVMSEVITVEHFHDMAKLTFAFIIFWAYMAFSQYFLIWYANLPEENYWYLYRWDNSWEPVSLLLVFGHFLFPFVGLITHVAKRSFLWLGMISIAILIMRYVDLYWLVMPPHYRDGIHFQFVDVTLFIGLGGLFVWWVVRRFAAHAVVPINEPGLQQSIEFHSN